MESNSRSKPFSQATLLINDVFNTTLLILWYLWKARNDARFNQKIWTPSQVHQAAKAHIATYQATNIIAAAMTGQQGLSVEQSGVNISFMHVQTMNRYGTKPPALPQASTSITDTQQDQKERYIVRLPALIQGVRCYTDASLSPCCPTIHLCLPGRQVLVSSLLIHRCNRHRLYTSRPGLLLFTPFSWRKQQLSMIGSTSTTPPFSLTVSS